MLFAICGVIAIFIFLILTEILSRSRRIKAEFSRKLVHIVIGSFVATWPFFTDMQYVVALAVAFFVVISFSRYFTIFKGIHSVRRKTAGEFMFPVGILLVALLADANWIFAAAILHLGFADGMAALIGATYGKIRYLVFKHQKSVIGTTTFWVCSVLIIEASLLFSGIPLEPGTWRLVIVVPVLAAILENISPYGTDNVTVPLFVVVALNSLV